MDMSRGAQRTGEDKLACDKQEDQAYERDRFTEVCRDIW